MSTARKPLSSRPLSPRQEAFCYHLAEGCSLAEAARRAGYPPASARQRASELHARPEIQARAAELANRRLDETAAIKDQILAGLRTVFDKAVDDDRPSIALRAATTIARLCGMTGFARRQSPAPLGFDEEAEAEPAPAKTHASRSRPAVPLPPALVSALDTVLGRPAPNPGPLAGMPLPGLG